MATFELFLDKSKQHRFHLKADNGEIVLSSEGYTTKDSALNGIGSVKRNASLDGNYVRKRTAAGWSFNLRAPNNKVVGTSEVYTSEDAREVGIASVKRNAAGARVAEI
jgi:uncharacterized protein